MILTISKVLMLIACIIAFVAFGVIVFGTPTAKFWVEALFLTLGFAWASFIAP